MACFGVFYFRVLLVKAAGWLLSAMLTLGAATFDYPAFAGHTAIPFSQIELAIVAPP
jgi:hypothetical protein